MRPLWPYRLWLSSLISIHALTRSATRLLILRTTGLINFNPRTHKECDHNWLDDYSLRIQFQSTHSQRVRLPKCRKACITMPFQSTHSQRVRHGYFSAIITVGYISIHALTKSATYSGGEFHAIVYNFNPRTHKECDITTVTPIAGVSDFNPRTHKECDPTLTLNLLRVNYFNPRTHKECDLLKILLWLKL